MIRYKDITIRMLLNHTSGFPGTNVKDGFTAVKNRNYVEETNEQAYFPNEDTPVSLYPFLGLNKNDWRNQYV